MRRPTLAICALLGAGLVAATLWAQQRPGGPGGPQMNRQQGGNNNSNNRRQRDKEEDYTPPDDKRLLEIHKKFVLDAEKLGKEYERDKQLDKARTVYKEILRLVPTYEPAQEALKSIFEKEAGADKKILMIQANKGWQDTDVIVAEGKPIHIRADGNWTVRLTSDTSGDGLEIPEELREFNLGALVGMIDDGNPKDAKPFLVGANHEFKAEKTGKLYLRMYDSDPADNLGKLNVTIVGTFYHPNGTPGKKTASAQ